MKLYVDWRGLYVYVDYIRWIRREFQIEQLKREGKHQALKTLTLKMEKYKKDTERWGL